MLTAIILTQNESQHLPRCIASLEHVVNQIIVADCYSNDETIRIAIESGALIIQKDWVNYADQFNWAITQVDSNTEWVLRIDADEYLTSELISEIHNKLSSLPSDVDGVFFGRRMTFQGRLIRHGGLFPVRVLRLFRYGKGQCENRWMDEHIMVSGLTVDFSGELIDDNLKTLTWWTEKHNQYASREVVDLLNLEYGFMPHSSVASLRGGSQAGLKRWIKEKVYVRLPSGVRAFAYFFYRYFVCLGFLDGKGGTSFHFLQGFWYRYLVDAKLSEVKRCMRDQNCGVEEAIKKVLEIQV